MDRLYLQVIDNKQSARLDLGIEEVVFEVGERIGVRTVE